MNPFAVLAAFVAVLEAALGGVVVLLAATAWARRDDPIEARDSRRNLLLATGGVLTGLAVAGWPLLHLLFESMVPQWPGVMCAEGITRIGTGARGATGHLPLLAATASALKPAVVFLCGCWVVLHRIDRRRLAPAATPVVLLALGVAGLAAVIDGSAMAAWLWIPKQATTDASGCCSTALLVDAGTLPAARAWAAPTFLALAPLMAILTALAAWGRQQRALPRAWGVVLGIAAAALVPVAGAFAADVAAPVALHLPHHRCLSCLFERAPESLVAGALFATASFAVGWAVIARLTFGDDRAPDQDGRDDVRALLRLAAFGYAATVGMVLTGWSVG